MRPIFHERVEIKTHYVINVGTNAAFVNPFKSGMAECLQIEFE
jgi:hypothetical protein